MITFTGVQMHPGCGRSPEPMDIAVGMCRITRYAGAIWCPLAAHSILVAEIAYRTGQDYSLQPLFGFAYGLLHDAHETVTGELTRHYKPEEMKPFERELDEVIFASFNVPYAGYVNQRAYVKAADEMALVIEATMLGLNGWPKYYRKMEEKDPPKIEPVMYQIGADIVERWSNERMIRAGSREIATLNHALQCVQKGHFDDARAALMAFE